MKILYGVQATGQGHISRARAMARALRDYPVEVTWLFSGRPREQLFDMEPFDNFEHRRGLTFSGRDGRIRYRATLGDNNVFEFLRDVRQLDLDRYELVVTDFEPVSAWAARVAGVPSIGIGHQYAFGESAPMCGGNAVTLGIMRQFAPVDVALGLHWYPYSSSVLPPILDLPPLDPGNDGHILVYLPFENQDEVTRLLRGFPERNFIQYANGLDHGHLENVLRHPASTVTFKQHLSRSAGVICNSGFELISECLQWRKAVLTKPLQGQLEQLSNALALTQLGYATAVDRLSETAVEQWLAAPAQPPACGFRDVAAVLARWLARGCRETPRELGERLWPVPDRTGRTGSSLLPGGAHAALWAPPPVRAD